MSDSPSKSHGRLSIAPSAAPRDLMRDAPRLKSAWVAQVITLFPEVFPGVLGASLTGKALAEGLWHLDVIDLRPFGEGKHRNVDDTPAGGGAGMVLRPDVMGKAIRHAAGRAKLPLIYLSPRGRPFDQARIDVDERDIAVGSHGGRSFGARHVAHFTETVSGTEVAYLVIFPQPRLQHGN